MTLCIAALCRDYNEPAIHHTGKPCVIVATDFRIETETAGAETEYKVDFLSDNWVAVFAGPVSQARELLTLYGEALHSHAVTKQNCVNLLREPQRQLRRRMADSLTHALHSISYEEFLQSGKTWLPDDIYRQTSYQISAQQIAAELILIGYFAPGEFVLLKTQNGDVEQCSHFAAIGSGAEIAKSVLFQRAHKDYYPDWDTIYSVYEAKKLSEIAPGVGKMTSYMCLNEPDPSKKSVLDSYRICSREVGFPFLEKAFRRFGPKPVKTLNIPKGFWY